MIWQFMINYVSIVHGLACKRVNPRSKLPLVLSQLLQQGTGQHSWTSLCDEVTWPEMLCDCTLLTLIAILTLSVMVKLLCQDG